MDRRRSRRIGWPRRGSLRMLFARQPNEVDTLLPYVQVCVSLVAALIDKFRPETSILPHNHFLSLFSETKAASSIHGS